MSVITTSTLSVMEAEVPTELLTQLDTLQKALKENKRLEAEIRDTNVVNELQTLEEKIGKISRVIGQQKTVLKEEQMRSAGLAQKIGLDQRIAHNVQRGRDQSIKNPQYGRAHSVDFLHEVAAQNERALVEQIATAAKLKQMLDRLKNADDEPSISKRDLAEHIQRFDKIFEQVAGRAYELNDATEKLRDCFMDRRRQYIGGLGMVDPFEKQKQKQKVIDAYSSLKGIDAFPSPNAILSISEYLPKQQSTVPSQPQFGTTPFGAQTAGSLFGGGSAKAFSFNQPVQAQQPSTGISLFGTPKPSLFNPTTTTTASAPTALFGAPATTSAVPVSIPLFGSATTSAATSASIAPATQSTAPPFGGFSNTLSSASSGTLFKGSAPAKPNSLFGPR